MANQKNLIKRQTFFYFYLYLLIVYVFYFYIFFNTCVLIQFNFATLTEINMKLYMKLYMKYFIWKYALANAWGIKAKFAQVTLQTRQ